MIPTIAKNSVVFSAFFVSSNGRRVSPLAACERRRSAVSVTAMWCLPRESDYGGGLRPIPSRTTVTRSRQNQKNCSERGPCSKTGLSLSRHLKHPLGQEEKTGSQTTKRACTRASTDAGRDGCASNVGGAA